MAASIAFAATSAAADLLASSNSWLGDMGRDSCSSVEKERGRTGGSGESDGECIDWSGESAAVVHLSEGHSPAATGPDEDTEICDNEA